MTAPTPPTATESASPDKQELDSQLFIRQKLYGQKKSKLRTYRDLVLGDAGFFAFLWYELLVTFIGPIPGVLGLGLRAVLYRTLFKEVGKGVVFGRSVVIRHPGRIRIGRGVVIDDDCLIDARGSGDEGVVIGDEVIVNRGSLIIAKSGPVSIGRGTNIGTGSLIVSMGGVEIGENVGIGGRCAISGGAFEVSREAESERDQKKYTRGPVRLGDRVWLGMRAIVLDGVEVGAGCIVGAGSIVVKDLPADSVAAGAPAVVKRMRELDESASPIDS